MSTTLTITLNTDNAAFEDYPENEIARILSRLALEFRGRPLDDFDGDKLRDVNGNTCGRVTVQYDGPEEGE